MGTRNYRRDANGRFAGSGGGTTTTTGRAGGFANANFRTRVAGSRGVQKSARRGLGVAVKRASISGAKSIARNPQAQRIVLAGAIGGAISGGRFAGRVGRGGKGGVKLRDLARAADISRGSGF